MSHCDCHNFLVTQSEYTIVLPPYKGNIPIWVRIPLNLNFVLKLQSNRVLKKLPVKLLDEWSISIYIRSFHIKLTRNNTGLLVANGPCLCQYR